MSVTAVVLIKSRTATTNDVAQALAEIVGVSQVFSVAGRYDLVAIVHVRQNEDLADLVSRRIHSIAGIVESETLIAFRVYGHADVDAGFALGIQR